MKRLRDRQAFVRWMHNRERALLRRVVRTRRNALREAAKTRPLPGECLVEMPKYVGLEGDFHDHLVDALHKIRRGVADGQPLCLSFRSTELMIASGTLLLFSEINRLKAISPALIIRCVPPKNERVAQVLQHLGLFQLMNYQSSVVPTRADVVSWRKASSSKVDGERVGSVIGAYESLQGKRAKQLFRGATEAMMNAMNHAYEEPRNDGLAAPPEERWWLFCREREESFLVGVCDLGIGIPRSLPAKYPDEILRAAIKNLTGGALRNDARLIQAATEIERTRTDRRGRGKGLADLKRIVDEVPGGVLSIFSNRGLLSYDGKSTKRQNFGRSIKGTVVLWEIPLSAQNVHIEN